MTVHRQNTTVRRILDKSLDIAKGWAILIPRLRYSLGRASGSQGLGKKMKVTLKYFGKARNPRLYINSDDADTGASFIEFTGGGYNRRFDEEERVARRYHGNAALCEQTEKAVFASFKASGYLTDEHGEFSMPPDAVLAFAAQNALKDGLIYFQDGKKKQAWQKMDLSFEVSP